MSRALAKAVRDKTYRPGPSRLCPIPKRPGSIETRTLTIQTVPDRIVAGDVRLIIQPVLDPMLAPFSFARPGRGAQHALATVLALAKRRRHWVWIVEDIKAFYDQIIHSRLMRALSSWLPDAGNVVEFVNLISHTGKKRGVRQGSSLSPLLAHIFRDHHITRPWQHRLSQLPLFSYLDDLLVPCESVDQAHMAYDTLSQLVTSAGLKLKGNAESNICRVAEGQEVIYLGYHLQCQGRQLRFTIAERAWCSLEDGFIEAHEKPCPPVAADAAVRGWLEYLGPCYRDETREAVLDRVYTTAAAAGFDELPSRETLMNAWFAAYGRWRRLRKSEAEKLDHRLILNAATADAR
ncbi:MAG: reverse transcriptase domain-containing protein [Phycisphaeraceae bacterium]